MWKRCTKGVRRGLPLYVRRVDYRNREFAVHHPTRGYLTICQVSRESCYNPARMRELAQKAAQLLTKDQ